MILTDRAIFLRHYCDELTNAAKKETTKGGGKLLAKVIKDIKTNALVLREEQSLAIRYEPTFDKSKWPKGYSVTVKDWGNIQKGDRLALTIVDVNEDDKVVFTEIDQVIKKD